LGACILTSIRGKNQVREFAFLLVWIFTHPLLF
jgi:hypothetical protein